MSKEMMIVFVYDTEYCQDEHDDPVKAVLYFHPSWVSDVQKLSLCGQLMGTTQFLRDCFSPPKIISLQNGKFVMKYFGRFVLAIGTDRNIPEPLLEHRANILTSLIRFYHRDIQNIYDQFILTNGLTGSGKVAILTNDNISIKSGQNYKNLSEKLYHIFETYLPILQFNGNIFQNVPVLKLPKSASNIFLDAMQLLQCCQQTKGVLGGCVLYHNKVLATQLSSELTKRLIITDPLRIKTTGDQINVNFHVPIGIQLIIIYISQTEYMSLTKNILRIQQLYNTNLNNNSNLHNVTNNNPSTSSNNLPFAMKRKIKRDKSLIFSNIPEEDSLLENPNSSSSNNNEILKKNLKDDVKIVKTQRPTHLPLRFKTISSKDIPESGFNSINFDETDSFPDFIGKTSVCSTPMTENKVLNNISILSICSNPFDDEFKLRTKINNENKEIKKNVLKTNNSNNNNNNENYIKNPYKNRKNSLDDMDHIFNKIGKHLTLRSLGIGGKKSNKKNSIKNNNIPSDDFAVNDDYFRFDDDDIIDDKPKTYHTITDPTYPIFNSDGKEISKYLYQEYIEKQYVNLLNDDVAVDLQLDGFDTDLIINQDDLICEEKPKSIELNFDSIPQDKYTEPAVEAFEINKVIKSKTGTNRKSLSLPLKSLNDELNLSKGVPTNIPSSTTIFDSPGRKKKLAGLQLTPLMTKLTILAMNDEWSSGFSSFDATPGVVDLQTACVPTNLMTPIEHLARNFIRRRSSAIKLDDVINDENIGNMQRVELFICEQQNMSLFLILDETSSQKQELISSMWDICLSRLPRIEHSLQQIINLNVDNINDKLLNDGDYSFIKIDPKWDTVERNGPWNQSDLIALEYMHNNLTNDSKLIEMILRRDDHVLYGFQSGQTEVFYQQSAQSQHGLPPPTDLMGTVGNCAKRRLERDHSILML